MNYASRAGEKLEYALNHFKINVTDLICADFGSSTGGFVDCLLQSGVKMVFAVDTGYGVLDWKLRNDKRAIVMERKNAMHILLPENVDLITIDTGWTKLDKIIPNAIKNLKDDGCIIALLKPHYEAESKMLRKGRLPDEFIAEVKGSVRDKLLKIGVNVLCEIESPILGEKGKNKEYLLLLKAT
jgi:23S rRNA (cytidine1920-2'-O)/16S rRNA (cytidine1409-2'-O)-methyltransferase